MQTACLCFDRCVQHQGAFKPIGGIRLGLISLALVGSVVLLYVLLRYISHNFILLVNDNRKMEVAKVTTITARTRGFSLITDTVVLPYTKVSQVNKGPNKVN